MRFRVLAWVFMVSAGCSGGGSEISAPAPPPSSSPPPPVHEPLTVADLTGSDVPDLTEMQYLAPGAGALTAVTPFNGRLTFSETEFLASFPDSSIVAGYRRLAFPEFSIDLITDGADLIPAYRNIISTWPNTTSAWDVVVGAGKVWKESGDGAWNRASAPITLVSRRVGEARNCIAMFLYDGMDVSNSFIQCSQELSPVCCYRAGDMRALATLAYAPGPVPDEAQIVADYRAEAADDLPVKNWSALPVANPDLIKSVFNKDVASVQNEQSLGAILLDDTLYMQAAATRLGAYPYPREARHGVFSVTKSMSGALAILYFAERYGDEIFDARITDYAPAMAGLPEWQGVTFFHALNMVTGTRGSDNQLDLPLIRADSAEDAINAIADLGDASPAPGTVFNYATTNYFVLSYALQQYVEAREGPGVFYWDLVDENVLDAIGVHNFAIQKTLETSGLDGIPTLGIGAFPTADDSAKIARLFMNAGEHNGTQILHRDRTLEATNRAAFQGFAINGSVRYQHSFRRFNYVSSTSRSCSFSGSAMEGLGGSYVLLVPGNGLIALRYTDADVYNTAPLADALDQIRPAC